MLSYGFVVKLVICLLFVHLGSNWCSNLTTLVGLRDVEKDELGNELYGLELFGGQIAEAPETVTSLIIENNPLDAASTKPSPETISKLVHLTHLELTGFHFSHEDVALVQEILSLEELQSLKVEGTGILHLLLREAPVHYAGNWTDLCIIDKGAQLTFKLASGFKAFAALRTLQLTGIDFYDCTMQFFNLLTTFFCQLQTVNIRYCRYDYTLFNRLLSFKIVPISIQQSSYFENEHAESGYFDMIYQFQTMLFDKLSLDNLMALIKVLEEGWKNGKLSEHCKEVLLPLNDKDVAYRSSAVKFLKYVPNLQNITIFISAINAELKTLFSKFPSCMCENVTIKFCNSQLSKDISMPVSLFSKAINMITLTLDMQDSSKDFCMHFFETEVLSGNFSNMIVSMAYSLDTLTAFFQWGNQLNNLELQLYNPKSFLVNQDKHLRSLPKLSIPTFSLKILSWNSGLYSFLQALISKIDFRHQLQVECLDENCLSDMCKFRAYLKQQFIHVCQVFESNQNKHLKIILVRRRASNIKLRK